MTKIWKNTYLFVLVSLLFPIAAKQGFASSEVEDVKKQQTALIYSGYDNCAPIGHHVFEESVLRKSSIPISFTPLSLNSIKSVFWRERSPNQLTDFTYSRFIVPALSRYEGWSLFVDGNDMMMRRDVAELWNLRDDQYAVMVVKHPEFSEATHSFGAKSIQSYPMLNWSSVILFNNAKCKNLTPAYVNTADYHDLHQFKWLESPDLIGELPMSWNHLVGYYPEDRDAALVHWTLGAPYQGGEFGKSEHTAEWFELKNTFLTVTNG